MTVEKARGIGSAPVTAAQDASSLNANGLPDNPDDFADALGMGKAHVYFSPNEDFVQLDGNFTKAQIQRILAEMERRDAARTQP